MLNSYKLTSYGHSASLEWSTSFSSSQQEIDDSEQLKSFNHYLRAIARPMAVKKNSGILPPGVLHVTDNLIIVERPPQHVNVQLISSTVEEINDDSSVNTYRIPLPWQIYFIVYDFSKSSSYYPISVRMFFMDSSLTTTDISSQKLYLPPLPNFYSSGLLCSPTYSSYNDITRYPDDISGTIQAAYDAVWNSGTNLDLTAAVCDFYQQIAASRIPLENTVLKNSNIDYSHISMDFQDPNQYYLSSSYVNRLFCSWEFCSIDNITDYSWPNPFETNFSFPYYGNESYIESVFADYLDQNTDVNIDLDEITYSDYLLSSDNRLHFCSWLKTNHYFDKTFDDILRIVYKYDISYLFSSLDLFDQDHMSSFLYKDVLSFM